MPFTVTFTLPSPFTSPIRRFSNDSGVVDVTADVLEDAVVVVVVVWVSEVVVSAVVITEDVDAVPSSTNSLLNFAAYVCAVEPA